MPAAAGSVGAKPNFAVKAATIAAFGPESKSAIGALPELMPPKI